MVRAKNQDILCIECMLSALLLEVNCYLLHITSILLILLRGMHRASGNTTVCVTIQQCWNVILWKFNSAQVVAKNYLDNVLTQLKKETVRLFYNEIANEISIVLFVSAFYFSVINRCDLLLLCYVLWIGIIFFKTWFIFLKNFLHLLVHLPHVALC